MIKNLDRKRAYKRVEWMLYRWKKLEQAVFEARNDRPREQVAAGVSINRISDPTASTAIGNITSLKAVIVDDEVVRNPEKWLQLINMIYNQCSEIERKIFVRRYIDKAKPTRIATDLYMADTTYFDIVNGIKSYAVELALQNGLVKIYEAA